MSTKPGVTSAPSASISRAPVCSPRPTATMRSPSTATSAVIGAPPVPSMTVPHRLTRSWPATSGGGGEGRSVDAVELCDVVAQDRHPLLVAQLGGSLVTQRLEPRPAGLRWRSVVCPPHSCPAYFHGAA